MSKACCGSDEQGANRVSGKMDLDLPAGTVESTFKVSGMDCADEIAAIQSSLRIEQVFKVEAKLMSSTVQVWYSPQLDENEIRRLINKSGVKVVDPNKNAKSISGQRIALVIASGVLVGLAILISFFAKELNLLTIVLCLVSIFCGGLLVFPKGLRAIRQGHLDMNVLMTVAVAGAVYLGDYTEAAMVVFLFAFSELLEAFSVVRARKAIQEVINVSPKVALLKAANGELNSVPVDSVKVGDTVVVRAGDLFPTDGNVISGKTEVNQAPLTGESTPVKKREGDSVYAGTVNLSGSVEVQVTKILSDSKVSQIIRMVEDAQKSKAPSQRFVDQFAKVYTPAVFVLGLLICFVPPIFFGGRWEDWIYKALVLLVIACPCALVISTPVSIVSGLTAMARRGVLVKGGIFLETLGRLKAVAVDKTGTITEGVPQVLVLKKWNQLQENEIIKIAASIEKLSNHPLAQAVVRYAAKSGVSVVSVEQSHTEQGRGIFATVEGHEYFLGNHRFTHELGVCSPDLEKYLQSLEEQAMSVVVVGHKPHDNCSGEVLGVFGIGDKIREEAKGAIQDIHKAGCEAVVMLSGDNNRTVSAISKQVGIDKVFGELLPDGKVSKIKELVSEYKYVGMVGDGVNDAPALAQASIGIAMGAIGTDAAIETADVALMKDDLRQLSVAIIQGKRTLGIIRFNIGFALVLKAIFLILALSGYSSMWMAIAADTGATLIVIINALRLLKIND
ncbi:cation-translocating P-type ATPase [Bdellovibrio sp. SKB1291214]|uniref:heavy metal translocating P-type ATPase n=1 Tax=Bdellovibrio sp. SKB1291214 TaxID=1732569 RepID=UPI000B51B9CF|nr:cation-translocating P-type ATPase [Bdellovibrio sp. SKB1291214]UYL09882.1 cation-translocating P-type ATPase [Bdellovibrio sp. SKB1291214]